MKIKSFTLLSLTVFLVASATFMLNLENKESYFPRENAYLKLKNNFLEGSRQYLSDVKFNREIDGLDATEVFAALKSADKLRKASKALDINWRFKGPDNVGGRTRAIIVDRNDTSHILAGGVSGGIWESFNGAITWQPYDLDFKISNVSAMAQGPDGSIYVGTGSVFDGNNNNKSRSSHFLGNGLFKLTGNGNSQLLAGPSIANNFNTDLSYINEIAVNPSDANNIFIATRSGIRESKDGGQTWQLLLSSVGDAHDIEVSGDGKILATFGGRIFASQDGGQTFSNTNIASGGGIRAEVEIAPSNSDIMYASVSNNAGCLFGVFRSNDAGISWTAINNTPEYFGFCQGFYDNTITIFPNNPGKIIVGGVDLQMWTQTSTDPAPLQGGWISFANRFNFPGNPFFVHADVHEFTFNPQNPNTLYIGTDGGVSVSFNINDPVTLFEGPTFSTSNLGFNVTQFYDIGINTKDLVVGGSQDNGSQLIGLNFNTGRSGVPVPSGSPAGGSGDGFSTRLFSIDPEVGITTGFFGNFGRLQGIGTTLASFNPSFAGILSGNLEQLCSNPSRLGVGEFCSPQTFYTSIGVWESFTHGATKDSVLLEFNLNTAPPPIAQGTILPYESKNNGWEQKGIVPADLFPRDTLTGLFDRKAQRINSNGINQFVVNFDTIVVDTNSKQITFNYRTRPVEVKPFIFGTPVLWVNTFEPTTPNSVTVRRDSVVFTERQITLFYQIEFPDSVQSMVSIANVSGRGPAGITRRDVWMSRDVLKGEALVRWFKIGGSTSTPDRILPGDNIISNEFSADGNHLFLGTSGGKLYRIDNINGVDVSQIPVSADEDLVINTITSVRQIADFGNRSVTGIGIDNSNGNNLIVALGNYGNSNYVFRTTNALAANVNFEAIDGVGSNKLPLAPTYDAMIDFKDNNIVFIATDIGVFATENAFTTATVFDPVLNANVPDVQWTEENIGLGRVPTMAVKQMKFGSERGAINQGVVYVGTHGRGVFQTDRLVGINEIKPNESSNKVKRDVIHIYPNPVQNVTTFDFTVNDLSKEVRVQIYNIKGQLILEKTLSNLTLGKNSKKLDISSLDNGTYVIRLTTDNGISSGKFIKN